jgi:tRNA(Ile)-lysidine synthase
MNQREKYSRPGYLAHVPSASAVSLRRAVGVALARRERVVVAVSGGLDSMVLLDAAASALDARRLVVATFDHGTGAAATAARALVERMTRDRRIECVAGRATRASTRHTEAAWREARWTFLREVSRSRSASIATAHTADDQIETVLMRTLRDAGARGLAGLLAPSDVLRPLLALRRAALLDYAIERGVEWAEDPTNVAPHFLRNRIRHDILPALRSVSPGIDRELLEIGERAAAWRRETETIAHVVSTVDRDERAVDVGLGAIEGLDSAQLGVLWPAVAARVGATLDRRGIGRVALFSQISRVGSRIQLSGGWEVVRSRHAFRLRTSQQETAGEAELDQSAYTTWGRWTFWAAESGNGAGSVESRGNSDRGRRDEPSGWNARLPVDQPLRVRGWRPGDRLTGGSGRHGGGRKVKRLLNDAGVTGHERGGWPVVLCGDQIVWVPGVRRSDAATERSAGGRPTLTFSCARHIG